MAMMTWLIAQQTLRPKTGSAATTMSTPRWVRRYMPTTPPTKDSQTKAKRGSSSAKSMPVLKPIRSTTLVNTRTSITTRQPTMMRSSSR